MEEKIKGIRIKLGKKGKKCDGDRVIEVLQKYREIFIHKPRKVKGVLGHIEFMSEKPVVQKSLVNETPRFI